MFTILLVILILVSIALIAVILLQRSEGGALGMGGGGSGSFMSARGTANLLTRTTSVLAVLFFALALGLVVTSNIERGGRSVTDRQQVEALDLRELAKAQAAEQAGSVQPAAPAATQPTGSLDDLTAPLPQAGLPTAAPAQTAPATPPPAQ